MPKSTSAGRLLAAGSLAAALLAALPAASTGATAPTRYVAVDTDGTRADRSEPIAIADDGRTALLTASVWNSRIERTLLRDLAAGTTTQILQPGERVWSADATLARLLFTTARRLDPADDNDRQDLYAWDRPSNTYHLLSKGADGKSLLTDDNHAIQNASISGNGEVAQFNVVEEFYGGQEYAYLNNGGWFVAHEQYRYSTAKGLEKLSDREGDAAVSIGDEGRVAANRDDVLVGGKAYKRSDDWRNRSPLVTSRNGGFVAWVRGSGELDASERVGLILGFDTSNGNAGELRVPGWLATRGYHLERIENDASSVTVGADTEPGVKYQFAKLDRSGNLRQYGGDVPISTIWPVANNPRSAVLSRNAQFALTAHVAAQLGSTALPGTEPSLPTEARATDFVTFQDAYCVETAFWWWNTRYKPSVRVRPEAQGSDIRRPQATTLKVFRNGSSTPSETHTLQPGVSKDLATGEEGGYRLEFSVPLADGPALTGSIDVPSHAAPTVCRSAWGGF